MNSVTAAEKQAVLAHYTAQAAIANGMTPLAAPTHRGVERIATVWGHHWRVMVEYDEEGVLVNDVQIDGVWMSACEVITQMLMDEISAALEARLL